MEETKESAAECGGIIITTGKTVHMSAATASRNMMAVKQTTGTAVKTRKSGRTTALL